MKQVGPTSLHRLAPPEIISRRLKQTVLLLRNLLFWRSLPFQTLFNSILTPKMRSAHHG
ncbi:hypothetical protein Nhal_1804 [Nitrosococcus halophilus Nc 4]|uniref:Uncharacterized protein n=1 Tax=Nitrosococcus halophilus (strain Nc4) TaxID=472759 RepID=D5C333_NITHN|nr:hypothetical protein Nhal_1804 [Nitrosococcus halophilus Nc 4]